MQYKISFYSPTKWKLRNATSLEDTTIDNFDPHEHKLFNFDVFEYDSNINKITLIHSIVKNMPKISGILVLSNSKTYGKTHNDKFYYKCIPDDKRIIPFLVPYKMKNIAFSKSYVNKYVVFKFVSWEQKHPIGELNCVIGDVNKLENFYEYQLYCKSLYASIQDFTRAAKKKLRQTSEETFIENILNKYIVEDRRKTHIVYSIDPKNSKDFDDAFSFKVLENNHYQVSVYISNVSIWMNALDLWESFSERISTIYLPDRKRPMLPTMLSDFLCSLQEKQTRFAFTLDLLVNQQGNIIEHSFKNTCICVKKNYRYSDDISNIENIKDFKIILNKMNTFNKYSNQISDTHNIISYLMILMNYLSAKEFIKHKTGIFRSMKINNDAYAPDYLPNNIQGFLRMWKSNGSKYISFEEDKIHEMLKLNEYIHITSPIRRLVDLLNMTELQHYIGIMPFNEKSKKFHNHWTCSEKLSYINQTMQSIRKVQNECDLLTKCILEPNVLKEKYTGYVFDIMERNDGLFQYVIFIDKLKLINKFISYKKLEVFSFHYFKLYLFDDKDSLKQKVRYELQL